MVVSTMRLEGTGGVGLSAARLPVIAGGGRASVLAGLVLGVRWRGGGFCCSSWSGFGIARVDSDTWIGVGSFLPTECPTTRFGRTSSGGLWGRQLLGATPHASRSA